MTSDNNSVNVKKRPNNFPKDPITGKQLPGPGRPKGSKNKLTILREAVKEQAENIILENLEEIVHKACELASKGDTTAIKLILDRIYPVHKAQDSNANTASKGITINISGQESIHIGGDPTNTDFNGKDVLETHYEEIQDGQ